jgi:hypothetical protein
MDTLQRPSRFLREIPEHAREEWDLVNGARGGWGEVQEGEVDPDW